MKKKRCKKQYRHGYKCYNMAFWFMRKPMFNEIEYSNKKEMIYDTMRLPPELMTQYGEKELEANICRMGQKISKELDDRFLDLLKGKTMTGRSNTSGPPLANLPYTKRDMV